MLITKVRIITVVFFFLLIPKISCAEEITIATGEFPPLYTEYSETNGVVLQIVKESFSAVGIKVNFFFVPWARANHYGKSGKYEASCCWFDQKERAKYAYYSDSVFAYTYKFFHLKTTRFDWHSINDLREFQIGGTESYTYTEAFTQAEKDKVIDVQRTSSDLKGMRMLLAGRVDIFPLNVDVAHYLLKHQFLPEEKALLTYHPKPLVNNYVHLVFSKENKKSIRLYKAFELGLKTIKDNGRYQQIILDYEKSK